MQAAKPTRSVLLAAAVALCALLAGCASSPMPSWKEPADAAYAPVRPAQAEPTVSAVPAVAISTAPPTRAALVAAARAEWDFFGNQQIDMRHDPFSAPRLGLLEDEGEAVQRVGEYWHAVGKNLTGADCQQAWSAAFISWLMVSSNVPPQDFAPNETHFNYLSFLKEREARPSPQFVLRPAASEPIAPGDLICAPRGNNNATTLDEIRPGLAGHCDMVVEVHADQGWAGAIGGNVFNSVSESLIPVDEQGRAQPISQRPWLVVVKNLLP
ncbi:DUF2272 domain-containing protein [Herbaspirillum robiniae]|uniref:DUF2272 domain-containing protein n=1 Tax=Herbaspirillum robiniae TaxID=2014887 RepID=A0A246WMX7_9BURK|nr:DUF2272 domain-containing protein [Herbaspirillum robiniae]OWY26842.1 hypothetical protein CEJ42_22150 [Herbaspirillum robiniae]